MKKIIQILNVIGWIGVGLGILMMLLGALSAVQTWSILPPIEHNTTYYHIANSCFLIAITLFVFTLRYQFKKE